MPTTLPTGPTETHLRVALGAERFALLPLRAPARLAEIVTGQAVYSSSSS